MSLLAPFSDIVMEPGRKPPPTAGAAAGVELEVLYQANIAVATRCQQSPATCSLASQRGTEYLRTALAQV
jgi:hypothetical protein